MDTYDILIYGGRLLVLCTFYYKVRTGTKRMNDQADAFFCLTTKYPNCANYDIVILINRLVY